MVHCLYLRNTNFCFLLLLLSLGCILPFIFVLNQSPQLSLPPAESYKFYNCTNHSESFKNLYPNHQLNQTSKILIENLSNFDWNTYRKILITLYSKSNHTSTATMKQIRKLEEIHEGIIELFWPHVAMEPLFPINPFCKAPLLTPPTEIKCEGHGNAFKGSLRKEEELPKIGLLIQFGFDTDVLEIHLNEVFDVVDRIFIMESTKAHFRAISKPLMWEKIKHQQRFQKFLVKIVHLIMDDSDTAKPFSEIRNNSRGLLNHNWKMETFQEGVRWVKFLQWNKAHKFFSENDLIGFGDADEIPSREILHLMKHCHLNSEIVDIGIWFPYIDIHHALASDFPVAGHRFTLGDPTFYTLRAAIKQTTQIKMAPGRQRGSAPKFLLGGIHMSNYRYLPYRLIREVTCTECLPRPPFHLLNTIAKVIEEQDLGPLELFFERVDEHFRKRIVKLNSIRNEMKHIAIVPWFYNCNRNRYPVWERCQDTRLID